MRPPPERTMKLRSQTRREQEETVRWTKFPPEIRNAILRLVQNFAADEKYSRARLATVSKEWQSFFEPALWHTLTLQPDHPTLNLKGLEGFVQGYQREMIKGIYLHVESEDYVCPQCQKEVGDQHTIINRERKLYDNLQSLLSILSTWPEDNPATGIWLHLTGEHPGSAKRSSPPNEQQRGRCKHLHSPSIDNSDMEIQSMWDVISSQESVHITPIITIIGINKSLSWSFSGPLILRIGNRLPRLQKIHLEHYIPGFKRLFQYGLGNWSVLRIANEIPTIKKVTIVEFRSRNNNIVERRSEWACREIGLPQAAVLTSFHLTDLIITDALDARDFFSHFNSQVPLGQELPNSTLQRLRLTCRLEQLSLSPMEVDSLLLIASQTAAQMPCLKRLVVWSPGVGKGFFFRYHVGKSEVNFTVASTWNFDVAAWQHTRRQKSVRAAWEQVASRHADHRFRYTVKHIDREVLTNRLSIYRYLRSEYGRF